MTFSEATSSCSCPKSPVYEPRMRGEYRRIAHNMTRARRLLAKEDADIWDPAVQCGALLTLYLHPGPLEPTGDTATESRSRPARPQRSRAEPDTRATP
ncbi:hypothetical protein AB4Z54_02680 [Streptomyces sp. MCAF7]